MEKNGLGWSWRQVLLKWMRCSDRKIGATKSLKDIRLPGLTTGIGHWTQPASNPEYG